ncbi:MAG: acetyl/propionyl/methylcrotonyl-CoA carboxylase subunit alpha [Gulosibacter sp.]|uniref:acetyl/propionyl/methylcrotonyl-CoA carboxylase subunit alpha n=1 Tax=Gulosibacter sp. TaxID=2817531 RepID=UPI003F922D78
MKKILIANRGEIAVRVIRAAKDAGIASVAVYADDDVDALHVRLADEAFALGGQTPAESYLNIEKILEIAARSSADAVHPGYGFLSERADFAKAVQDAGLTWIGPDPETIELLGDKARARALAAEVGAPLVPGTQGAVSGVEEVLEFVDTHGLPVVIKAVFGGGGRGMRVVRDRAEVRDAYEAAVREAVAAFGRGDCLVERFLDRPRHIEAQVLGDKHGRVQTIGTRDCSLQRRNQKLVEEAPAPFLSDELRVRIHRSAEDVCAAANYVGAGTVEFLLGEDGTLSFLEVNTRLQVEHPITEEVTGVDLVQEQFRVASGEPLTLPEEIPAHGHAFEFRINAEDPALGYLPTPGVVERFEVPGGPGVRVDVGVYPGYVVPGTFDSLLAKLIVWGKDRNQALARARRALEEFQIDGVASVLPFDRYVVTAPAFIGNDDAFAVHTRWIEEESDADFDPAEAVPVPAKQGLTRLSIEIDGRMVELGLPQALLSGLAPTAGSDREDQATESTDSTADDGALLAPFAGILSEWKLEDGADVEADETVALIEAMKMEMPIKATRSGKLSHAVEAGHQVTANAVLGSVRA